MLKGQAVCGIGSNTGKREWVNDEGTDLEDSRPQELVNKFRSVLIKVI